MASFKNCLPSAFAFASASAFNRASSSTFAFASASAFSLASSAVSRFFCKIRHVAMQPHHSRIAYPRLFSSPRPLPLLQPLLQPLLSLQLLARGLFGTIVHSPTNFPNKWCSTAGHFGHGVEIINCYMTQQQKTDTFHPRILQDKTHKVWECEPTNAGNGQNHQVEILFQSFQEFRGTKLWSSACTITQSQFLESGDANQINNGFR